MSGLNYDKLKSTLAGSRGSGWKPKVGQNRVRVLPPGSAYLEAWDTMTDAAVHYRMHFFKIGGNVVDVSRCLEDLKQRCPACDAWRAYRGSEDPGLKQMAGDVRAGDQYLFNILDVENLQAGLQPWAANYTCWSKVMEIVANPEWGNVLDPANGVDFNVKLTAGSQSRTGYNSYSVTPVPSRTNVVPTLDAIDPNWRRALDGLEANVGEAKDAAEIAALLERIGFPTAHGYAAPPVAHRSPNVPPALGYPYGGGAGTGAPSYVPSPPTAAAPAYAPPPASLRPDPLPSEAAPASWQVPAPATVPAPSFPAPAPVGPPAPPAPPRPAPPVAGPPVGLPAPVAGPPAGLPAPGVHYDPGPTYRPKVPDTDRPVGAPRCFGDYDPTVHRCQPCPVVAACQLRLLNVSV